MVAADFGGSNGWESWGVSPLKLMTLDELELLPDPEWLVDGVLQLNTLALLYGPPATTKTFIGLDLALSVASGREWLGHRTKAGSVVYVHAEGSSSLKLRVRSWRQAHPDADIERPPRFADEPVDLLDDEAVENLGDLLHGESLIVLDTLARCMPGDENSSKDMGRAIGAMDRLRSATGATVLAVHHSRKSGDAERGSSALPAAVATQLAVSRRGDDIEIRCEKQKDAEPFEPIRLRLDPVGGSCAVRALGNTGGQLTPTETEYLRLLPDRFGNNPVSRAEWNDASGLSERSADRRRKRLLELRFVRKTGSKKDDPFEITDVGLAALVANVAT